MITTDQIQSEISSIDRKLKELEQLRKRRDALAALMATYSDNDLGPRLLDAPSIAPNLRFNGLGTTEAINLFLRESPGIFFSPREIAKGLLAGGHEPSSPNFNSIVFTICKRKGKSGFYETSAQDGKTVFRMPISNQPQ